MSKNTKRILIILVVAIAVCIVGVAAAVAGWAYWLIVSKIILRVTRKKCSKWRMSSSVMSSLLATLKKWAWDFLVYKMIVIGQGDDDKIHSTQPMILPGTFSTDPGNDS